MISLFKYVSKYGDLSFNEEEFNEVDNVILSLLSYIDFKGIVSNTSKKISLKEASEIYFSKYTKKELDQNIFSIKSAIKLFDYIKDFKRYQELKLYNYSYEKSINKQFSAMCIKITDDLVYVSYEGTDELISGWKEDFDLSYMFPIPSQVDAVNYLNKSIKLRDKKVIVGGHSKGGNLALVSAMYCNFWIRRKIIKIYSNDGPGLLEEELNSYSFKKIKSRYVHIIPDKSIVGIMLENCNDLVIKASKGGILAHDALNWEVLDNSFIYTELNESSKKLNKIMKDWLDEYSFEQRMVCVEELFSIFSNNNINSLIDIKKSGVFGIIKLIRESKNLGNTASEMFKQLISLIYDDYSSMIKDKISFNKDKDF
ncbi:MAG: DUF2974 domain-containing protein [Bacilli bacterium]|nr:DUF2974 domain-containing protein [Bacilli bacterium]